MFLWIYGFYDSIPSKHIKSPIKLTRAKKAFTMATAVDEARLVDTGLSCVAFALLIGDYMAKSVAWSIWVGQAIGQATNLYYII
jgi:hypothetical protein